MLHGRFPYKYAKWSNGEVVAVSTLSRQKQRQRTGDNITEKFRGTGAWVQYLRANRDTCRRSKALEQNRYSPTVVALTWVPAFDQSSSKRR